MVLEGRTAVIDASLAINFALPTQPYHTLTVALIRSCAAGQTLLAAPPLFESEADGVIRRYIHAGLLDADAGQAAQDILNALPVTIIQDDRVRRRAREIAQAFDQQRVYDSTYAALAEVRGCDFWTADRAFYRDVRQGLGFVRFIGDFVTPNPT